MPDPKLRRPIALLFLLLWALVTKAAVRSWPTGAAPCNDVTNLQACVDAAASGDVIEIAANAIPSQSVEIPRSFTPPKRLSSRPAAGFAPEFADFSSMAAVGGDVEQDPNADTDRNGRGRRARSRWGRTPCFAGQGLDLFQTPVPGSALSARKILNREILSDLSASPISGRQPE